MDRVPRRRMLPTLREVWGRYVERNFEGWFIASILVAVAAISWFVPDKLAFLNFFYLPVLLAGYFLSVRSAVLGSLLAIAWVSFFAVLRPEEFESSSSDMALFLHVMTWGSFLVLCGVLVGRLNEQVMEKFTRLREVLEQWRGAQTALETTHKTLEEKNQALDGLRAQLETVLYSSMDAVSAHLAVTRRLADEKRELSALAVEVDGVSEAMASLPPAEAVGEINSLYTRLVPVLASFRGHLDSMGPRGLTAEFGVPAAARNSALLAVMAALKMQEKAGGSRWRLRIGVAHGEAVVGLIGSEHRRSYAAAGGAVDRAARLRESCPPGGVCVDEAVHALIRDGFHTRRLDGPGGEASGGGSAGGPGGGPARPPRGPVSLRSDTLTQTYQILAVRGPFEDRERLPAGIKVKADAMFRAEGLAPEMLQPMEAVMGVIGHSQSVAALSYCLADAMGLTDDTKRAVFLAGFFHEIGMRSLPESVMSHDERTNALSEEDFKLLQAHPLAARGVLKDLGLELPDEAHRAVREHLQNFDGSARPLELKGDRIALGARIVRIAHEYDALTAWRPGREAWTPAAALAGMRLDADLGGKLDPHILDVFFEIIGQGGRKAEG